MKTQKLYFLDSSSEICYPLDRFSLEELEEVDYEIYEAIPDNGKRLGSMAWKKLCAYTP